MIPLVGKFGPWSFLQSVVLLIAFAFPFAVRGNAQYGASSSIAMPQNPDNQLRRSWQVGGFAMGGFPPNYEIHGEIHYHEELNFYSAGLEAGWMLTALHGHGPLHGRGEAVVELIPFWLAHAPKQEDLIYTPNGSEVGGFDAYSVHGVSITPLLFRWNFMKQESSRFVPWAQLGSGLLWTATPFPQGTGRPGGHTSRINFTPQVDLGTNIFTRRNQSLNLAVKAIHISSANLGEYNPGVNVTLQFSLGYSWWK